MKIDTYKCHKLIASDFQCGDIHLKIQMLGEKKYEDCVVTKKGQDQLIDFMIKIYQNYLKRMDNAK